MRPNHHGPACERRRALPHLAIPTTLSVAELAAGAGFTNEAGDKAACAIRGCSLKRCIYDAR